MRARGGWPIGPFALSGEDEVVELGDAEHGVLYAVAFEAGVTQDLPTLHAGEGMLDAGADLLLGFVVRMLSVGQLLAFAAPVGHHETGARVAAVSDRRGVADGGFGAGFLPRLAVVAVAGQRASDHHDQAGVGIGDDLVVGGTA